MYTVKIKDNIYKYEENKTLEQIAKELNVKCYVAKVNNRLRELTFYLNFNCEVEFLDLNETEAVRVYQTTLRYIIAMAVKRIDCNATLTFNDYVSRSFIGILENSKSKCNSTYLNELNNEIDLIIKNNYPIIRHQKTKLEVSNLYKQLGFDDKYNVLQYRDDENAHYYSCDGYIDYMYGYMLPSTGYIKDYKISIHHPGFIVQYPRAEFGGKIPEFQDDPSFGKMIKKAWDWKDLCGVDNISSMNSFANTKEYIQFINMCETKHNDGLAEIGNIIKNNIDDIKLILIAGPSSSGKTTFTNRLKIELLTKGIKPVMISMDDYYVDRDKTPVGEDGKADYESLYALNIDLFNQQLVELIQGEEVKLPYFDFEEGKSKEGKTVKLGKNQPILIEGIHALNEMVTSLIPKHQKFKIFISPHPQLNIDNHNPIVSTDLRLLRRIVRDARTRNTSPSKTFSMWSAVRKGEFKWIYPWQKEADYVFNTSLTYEIMIMKKYALPALLTIKSNDEYFIQANRLIKFLKYVKDVDDKYVPCNSILREFIGDSCFYD